MIRLRLTRGAAALGLVLLLVSMAASLRGSAASLSLASQQYTPYRTCIVTATPATTTAVRDASVRQQTPAGNFGTTTTFDVASANNQNRRAHLFFDIAQCAPAIPSTAVIRLATLRLYVTGLPAACRTLDVFRVTASWAETTLTWNNQPFGTTINNPPTASATDQFGVGTPVGCENRVAGYVTGAIVTADVAAWVAGGATNFGWMIRDDVENSATARTTTFSAKELATIAQEPQLVITYVAVP